jgi:hypothetical protein
MKRRKPLRQVTRHPEEHRDEGSQPVKSIHRTTQTSKTRAASPNASGGAGLQPRQKKMPFVPFRLRAFCASLRSPQAHSICYAAPAAARPRASLGNDFTVDRIVRNDNPLLTNPRNPKNMNGMVSAKNAKIEKLVAVVLST